MNKQQIKLFASKKTDDWQTPPWLYDKLNNEFSFDYDPCPLNSSFDGLKTDWGKRCFVNPPYSKVDSFLKKAYLELRKNTHLAVFLTFANTDTKWFHQHIYHRAEIRFLKGRIKFLDETGEYKNSAMRPSMIAILRR